ncbi:MAG: hypothetical protein ACW97Z_14015 [Candidatus Hodarchaeales archaeon]|jgi:hypothetical protein
MQGEIHRDERKRKRFGWKGVITGVIMIAIGVSTLMLYVRLFV